MIANDITSDKRKRALVLYQAGSRIREIVRQLQDTGEDTNYQRVVGKLHEPRRNRLYKVYHIRQAKELPGETLDQFHTLLRILSQTCEFSLASLDLEIMLLGDIPIVFESKL